MELIEQYKKETRDFWNVPWSDKKEIEFLQAYAKWLEAKINYTRCSLQLNTYTNINKPIVYKGEKYKILSIDYFKELVNINDLKTESKYIKNVPFKDCTQSV